MIRPSGLYCVGTLHWVLMQEVAGDARHEFKDECKAEEDVGET